MRQVVYTDPPVPSGSDKDDPFRYGWRYVRRVQPDGTTVIDQIPLTFEDLLYPEEDDFVVQDAVCKDAHDTTRLVEQDVSRGYRTKTSRCVRCVSRVGKLQRLEEAG